MAHVADNEMENGNMWRLHGVDTHGLYDTKYFIPRYYSIPRPQKVLSINRGTTHSPQVTGT